MRAYVFSFFGVVVMLLFTRDGEVWERVLRKPCLILEYSIYIVLHNHVCIFMQYHKGWLSHHCFSLQLRVEKEDGGDKGMVKGKAVSVYLGEGALIALEGEILSRGKCVKGLTVPRLVAACVDYVIAEDKLGFLYPKRPRHPDYRCSVWIRK